MIDYGNIYEAIEYYKARGYEPFDAPWLVDKKSYYATKPPESKDLHVPAWDSYLVASGEQSFIQSFSKIGMPKKALCVTPCFRDEAVYNEYHKPYFMKVELIRVGVARFEELIETIHDALSFFEPQFFKYTTKPHILKTSDVSYDIMCNVRGKEVELGSYGLRYFENVSWVYGTGVAEPRLSHVLKKLAEY